MKQSTKRLASVVLGLLFIVGALVIYFYFVRPANEEAQKIKSDLVGQELFLESQKSAVSQVENLINSYKQAEGKGEFQDVISMALPLSADYAGALAQLAGIVQNNGLSLKSLSFGTPGSKGQPIPRKKTGTASSPGDLVKPLNTLRITVNFDGSYENFKKFLRNLETNIRIFDVETLGFSPVDTTKSGQDNFGYKITVLAYYQNP